MISFSVFKEHGVYKIRWRKTQEISQTMIDVPGDILSHVEAIATYINNQKTPEELEYDKARQYAATLTDEEKLKILPVFPLWAASQEVAVGYECVHFFKLYRCLQAHKTQADWEPQNTPALWLSVSPSGTIPEFVQPTGSHDAYNIGDQVLFEGVVYESTINANVWSPTAYPAGWKVV